MANLYRKAALDKISSPDQLDKTLKITSPSSWLALLGITLIVVVTVIWSIVGTIPVTISASGIIASPVGTNSIYTDESGTVTSVMVSPGSEVHLGDQIMSIMTSSGDVYTVVSDQVGTVYQVVASVGDTVTQSSEVVRVSPSVTGSQAVVVYVPIADAKKLERGMSVYVTLASADSQSYGHMEARVINIDARACSNASMAYVLGSDNNLSSSFTANGAVAAVTCELYPDSESANGYYWSNEKGKKLTVSNGSLCTVKIITERVAPITKLFAKITEIWGN
jgi:multidrug resistance efflux pump